jgi:CheY-like chemotaxis protein
MALVLVVDDSEDLLEMYGEILSLGGHRTATAISAEIGLERVKELHPDVVLLDMMMPGTDGLGFLVRLRRECPGPLPVVVANSGFDGYRDEALRLGACAFLRKPVAVDDLLQSVASALVSASVSERVLASNEKEVRASRRRALEESAATMAATDRRGTASLRPSFEALVAWLSRYYGFGNVFLSLLHGTELWVEAAAGDDPEIISSYKLLPRQATYCDDVIDAGSTLYLTEPSRHPSPHFSQREVARTVGARFYLGAPLTTPRNKVVLGTLCLVDTQPREMHGEDMRLMERLALNVGRAVESLVEHGSHGGLGVDCAGVVDRPLLELLLDVALQREARIGGEVRLAVVEREPPGTSVDAAAYPVSPGPRFVVARLRPQWLALLHDDQDADVVRRTMGSALNAIGVLTRENEVSWRPGGGEAEEPLSWERARAIREEMLGRAEP